MMRRYLISFFVLLFASSFVLADTLTPEPVVEEGIAWYDASQWPAQGRGWSDTSMPFTRMPARAKETVPGPVWNLAQQSAGLIMRFKTNATKIQFKHEVGGNLTMPHMTTVASSGLDLYARDEKGQWRWAGFSKPDKKSYSGTLLKDVPEKEREYMLYLPLYNNTVALSVGVPKEARFEALAPMEAKPIFYYGTSIAQGCSASRCGMTVPALLGRRFDRPVVNFGFSGNGRMEQEMAELIGEVPSEVYVLDCLPNMSKEQVRDRTEPFVRKLRHLQPETPLIFVEDRTYANAWLNPKTLEYHAAKRKFYREAFDKLTAEGFKNIYYIDAESLIGNDDEATVDASHLTDLGMIRQTETLEKLLKQIIKTNSK